MIEIVLGFVQNILAGHWAINILVLITLVITFVIAVVSSDVESISKPLKQRTVWLLWLFGGLWGIHWICTSKDDEAYGWTGISCLATIISLLFLTFDLFDEQYSIVAVFILAMFVFNVLFGAFKIPRAVAKFNARYYRRHIDTDLILNNETLPEDNFIIDFRVRLEEFDKNICDLSEIVKDKEYGTEDAETSFFKNIFTFGNYNKLQKEKARLQSLADVCNILNDEVDKNEELLETLEDYLIKYRSAAYRNLNLCKDLLGLLKTIDGKKQSVVHDSAIAVPEITTKDILDITSIGEVKFDSDSFGKSVMMSVDSVNNSLTSIMEQGGKITATDLKLGAIEVGISAIASGVTGIIDLNAETSEQREKVQLKIAVITRKLSRILPELNEYRVQILRQIEILSALKEMCVAFIKVYEPLRQNVYNSKGGMVDEYQDFLQQESTRYQLSLLIAICNNYSKVNQAK